MLHDNSILSSRTVDRYNQNNIIMDVFRNAEKPLEDRDVHFRSGITELVSVRRAITNLIQAGKLVEVGSVVSERTARRVRVCCFMGGKWARELL